MLPITQVLQAFEFDPEPLLSDGLAGVRDFKRDNESPPARCFSKGVATRQAQPQASRVARPLFSADLVVTCTSTTCCSLPSLPPVFTTNYH